MWRDALAAGAQLYLTGEMRHHDALAAAAAGMVVVCVGHSNSERPTLGALAERLGETLDQLEIIPSDSDRDPFEIV
jgi:putative NIF3 family GTP cyclohydrolase 1 type 2